MAALKSEVGKRFGRLTVIRLARPEERTGIRNGACWVCICDCGKRVAVLGARLRNRHTLSCGCLHRDIAGAVNRRRLGIPPTAVDNFEIDDFLEGA